MRPKIENPAVDVTETRIEFDPARFECQTNEGGSPKTSSSDTPDYALSVATAQGVPIGQEWGELSEGPVVPPPLTAALPGGHPLSFLPTLWGDVSGQRLNSPAGVRLPGDRRGRWVL